MSTKKLINELLEKLKVLTDPVEIEELEDQILILVEQDEITNNLTKLDPTTVPNTPTTVPNTPTTAPNTPTSNKDLDPNLEPEEKIRLERQLKKKAKEEQYKIASKLESKEEELLRAEMMNRALASDDDYAFRKENRSKGAKNKNKKKQYK
jgi:hypothetical protein